jgi:hypothetical protein
MRALGLAGLAAAAPGAAAACALELILAVDVSGSVNAREYALQAAGMAAAFRHPDVAEAVEAMPGGMAVAVTQWSGLTRQRRMTGWHLLSDAASLAAFAERLETTPRAWRNFSTAIGEALAHARAVSREAPVTCRRRVIDVSGDGVSNEGPPPRAAADRLAAEGYTVNGLVILGAEPDPAAHYAAEVIAGPGAFVEVAADFEDYPRAFLRKLLREIAPPVIVSGRN